jgi:ABC-2 type transport system ATP-binding protein
MNGIDCKPAVVNIVKIPGLTVLSIDSIHKHYGPVKALQGVSFEVPEGSVYGILGPNGSGKTTLLSIILDVLGADRGSFRWFGQTGSPRMRRQIGTLLETPNFYHYLSGRENLRITRSISGRGDEADIDRVLSVVNLTERRNSRFSTYSLGMKQRLAIAGSLLGSPKVLVLDEPSNGLDPVGIAEIRQLIVRLRQEGHTIIMASHLLDEVEKVCTHVAILKKGELVAEGRVEEVMSDIDLVEMSAADPGKLREALAGFPGIGECRVEGSMVYASFAKGKAPMEALNTYCFSKGITVSHLILKKKKLEERFFELTGNISNA